MWITYNQGFGAGAGAGAVETKYAINFIQDLCGFRIGADILSKTGAASVSVEYILPRVWAVLEPVQSILPRAGVASVPVQSILSRAVSSSRTSSDQKLLSHRDPVSKDTH